ncbi:MAG: hypothetical protein SWJ54_07915 [Cyanobacteriota bacterium]|nr:hypothetical protein [Cyanobacteriota bacterium]
MNKINLPQASILALGTLQSLLLSLAIAQWAIADDANTVQQVFADYKSAILTSSGDRAVDKLSQSTIDYYGEMRKLAVCESAETVKAESMVNRVQILSMRFRVPTETLVELSDREVVVYAVDRGWIGEESVMKLDVAEVTIEGEEALAEVVRNGEPTGIQFRFVKETEGWKFDLLSTIELTNQTFEQLAEVQGLKPDEFIFAVLEILEGRTPTKDIWNPVAPDDPLCV